MTGPITIRGLVDRFWQAVDNEGVILFQFIFGAWFIAAGLNGILVADFQPPLTLRGEMHTLTIGVSIWHLHPLIVPTIRIWYCLFVIGPLISLLGKTFHGRLRYSGMWLQLTGDVVIALALLAYVTGTVHVESWGKGGFGAFLGGALCTSAAMTLMRDVRRLGSIEKRLAAR